VGVTRVANAAMERAIRAVSIERGYDPREFALLAFGGAGPLHACHLAESLRIPRVLIPRLPGVLSALGMILCDLVRDYSRTLLMSQNMINRESLDTIFKSLEAQARRDFEAEGISLPISRFERALEMRYDGQSHEVEVAEPEDGNWIAAFEQAHEQHYGYRHDHTQVEAVNIRLRASAETPKPDFDRAPEGWADPTPARVGEAEVWFEARRPTMSSLYERDALLAGNHMVGPAIVFQLDATTCIPPGWAADVDAWGNLIITQ